MICKLWKYNKDGELQWRKEYPIFYSKPSSWTEKNIETIESYNNKDIQPRLYINDVDHLFISFFGGDLLSSGQSTSMENYKILKLDKHGNKLGNLSVSDTDNKFGNTQIQIKGNNFYRLQRRSLRSSLDNSNDIRYYFILNKYDYDNNQDELQIYYQFSILY